MEVQEEYTLLVQETRLLLDCQPMLAVSGIHAVHNNIDFADFIRNLGNMATMP